MGSLVLEKMLQEREILIYVMKKISFKEIDKLLDDRFVYDLIRIYDSTKDLELKVIISIIHLMRALSKEKVFTLFTSKLMLSNCLEKIDFWERKVDTSAFSRIKTKEDGLEWLKNNLVGKIITIKRYGRSKISVSDLLS